MRYSVIVFFISNILCAILLAQSSTLIVTATNDIVNGDVTSPSALIENPGIDGISIREAILATNRTPGPHIIVFDPSLKGTKILITENFSDIQKNPITIDGDIDSDFTPDITLESKSIDANCCFKISTSNVIIRGFKIINFGSYGIDVSTGKNDTEPKIIENILLEGNEITGSGNGISVTHSDQFCTISNVAIQRNTIIESMFAINIHSASFQSGWERLSYKNKIEDISITNNVLSNNLYALYATGAIRAGSKDNSISGLTISDNNIPDEILISAGNSIGVQNNKIENLIISGNKINGRGASIEILSGGNGDDENFPVGISRDVRANKVSNVKIIGNNIRGGGIQFVGTDMGTYPSEGNSISNILIEKNVISDCDANGIYFICGDSESAKNNLIDSIKIVNNLIINNKDAGILLIGGYKTAFNNIIRKADIINNTIVGNGASSPLWAGGINFQFNKESSGNLITGVKIINTILWENEGNDCIRGPNTPESVEFSIIGDRRYKNINNNFYNSPRFVSPENFDFRLNKTSPLIDQGDPNTVTLGNTDLLGNNRIVDGDIDGQAVIDIGAIEYDPNITGMQHTNENEIPYRTALYQNYPNPFNPTTTIDYEIPEQSNVKIEIFDALGRRVETLVNKEQSAGKFSITFDASKFSSGIYFYTITANSYHQTKKMILLR